MKIVFASKTASAARDIAISMALAAYKDLSVNYTVDGPRHTYDTCDGGIYKVDLKKLTLTFTGRREVFVNGCGFGVVRWDGPSGYEIRLSGLMSSILPLTLVST